MGHLFIYTTLHRNSSFKHCPLLHFFSSYFHLLFLLFLFPPFLLFFLLFLYLSRKGWSFDGRFLFFFRLSGRGWPWGKIRMMWIVFDSKPISGFRSFRIELIFLGMNINFAGMVCNRRLIFRCSSVLKNSILLLLSILKAIAILKMLVLDEDTSTYLSGGKLFLQRLHLLGLRLLTTFWLGLMIVLGLFLLFMI